VIIKDTTAPQMCCHTTLGNITEVWILANTSWSYDKILILVPHVLYDTLYRSILLPLKQRKQLTSTLRPILYQTVTCQHGLLENNLCAPFNCTWWLHSDCRYAGNPVFSFSTMPAYKRLKRLSG